MPIVADEKRTLANFMQVVVVVIVLYLIIRYALAWGLRKDALSNKNVKQSVKDDTKVT